MVQLPQAEMDRQRFRDVVRMIKKASPDRARQIKQATFAALKRLGKKRNPAKAVAGMPDGTDTFNVRTLFDWMDAIKPGDRRAIRQLVELDATADATVKG